VSLHDVEAALRANNLNFTGGYAERGGFEQPIRMIGRLGPRPEQVVADAEAHPAEGHAGPNDPAGERRPHRGRGADQARRRQHQRLPRRRVDVTKQPHADTRAITGPPREALREIEASLPADVVIRPNCSAEDFIDRGVFNVGEALVIGAVLVVVVLFLFLLNFRTTFITLTAIPLSLVITTLVFR
jgi:Cu/Ag efflux pump CusA